MIEHNYVGSVHYREHVQTTYSKSANTDEAESEKR